MDKNIHRFWNLMEIPTPVILSIALKCQNGYEIVAEMKHLMSNIKKTLCDFKLIDIEAAILSRLIYQLKLKLRQEKSLKVLQKINRCLTNYNTIHFPFIVSSIEETLEANCGPSRQMLEWALVRIYGIAHLFHRVHMLCVEAVGHLFVKIKLGQLWNMTLVPIAVCSRLWALSQFVVRNACEWYTNLHPYLDKLELSASPLLPQGCHLPRELNVTLKSPSNLENQSLQDTDIISNLNTNSDLMPNETSKLLKAMSTGYSFERVSDMGVCISRTSFEEFGNKGSGDDENRENQQSSCEEFNDTLKRVNTLPFCNINKDCTDKRKFNKMPTLNSKCAKKAVNKKQTVNQNTASTQKCALNIPQISVDNLYQHSVESIESTCDLENFLKFETHLQNKYHINSTTNKKPLIRNHSKLQWLPIQHFIEEQIRLIKKAEKAGKSDKKEKILKAVKVYIKKRIKSYKCCFLIVNNYTHISSKRWHKNQGNM